MTHNKPVGVLLLSLPNTKNASPVLSLTALTSTLKSRAWIMKNSAETAWAKNPNLFVRGCKRYVISKITDLQIGDPNTSFATQICASGRSGNFASCRMRVRV